MITSKSILKLSEEYLNTKNIRNTSVEIYKNPTNSDITKMVKAAKSDGHSFYEIRFIADGRNKVIYAWDSYLAIHEDIAKTINVNLSSPTVLHGECQISGGRVSPLSSDVNTLQLPISLDLPEFFSIDWRFMDKYLGDLFSKDIEDKKRISIERGWIKRV